MGAAAKTRPHFPTIKSGVNRNASTITKGRFVSAGTPTGSELAFDGANVGGVAKVLGALQEDCAAGGTASLHGAGSIVEVESDGSGTIAYGADVEVVAGGSLAVSGRVKTLDLTTAGTHYHVGKSVSPATIAATAGAKVLVELCHPTPVIVPA